MVTTLDFASAYMRLRTLLDSLEVNTLRYCLDGVDRDDCVSRMIGLEADLLNVIEHVGGESPCPDGYFNCGGVCVVYSCAEEFLQQSEASQADASEADTFKEIGAYE